MARPSNLTKLLEKIGDELVATLADARAYLKIRTKETEEFLAMQQQANTAAALLKAVTKPPVVKDVSGDVKTSDDLRKIFGGDGQ